MDYNKQTEIPVSQVQTTDHAAAGAVEIVNHRCSVPILRTVPNAKHLHLIVDDLVDGNVGPPSEN